MPNRSLLARLHPSSRPGVTGSSGHLKNENSYTIEQDHRGVKRVTKPMLGFKSFEAAQSTLTGIELMHMLRKGQLEGDEVEDLSAAEPFYAFAS